MRRTGARAARLGPVLVGAALLGSCGVAPRLGKAGLSGALWVGSPEVGARSCRAGTDVPVRRGERVVLEVLGLEGFRVLVNGDDVFRGTDQELRHHLARLDLTDWLAPFAGTTVVLEVEATAGPGSRPALIARLLRSHGLAERGVVTGGPDWKAPSGEAAPTVEGLEGFLRPPLTPLPCLPLPPSPPQTLAPSSSSAGKHAFDVGAGATGYADVAFAGPSRGSLRFLAGDGRPIASEPFETCADHVARSLARRTCQVIEVVEESGSAPPERLVFRHTGAVEGRDPVPFGADDPALVEADVRACRTAARLAHGYVEDGASPPSLQVTCLRPAALALYAAYGHYLAPRRSLELLAEGRRASGAIRAIYPQEGEGAIEEPPEASAAFVVAVRDYVLYSGDLQAARRLWPEVDRQLTLLHRRADRSRLVVESPAGVEPAVHGLDANAMYAGALLAGADVAAWIGRINAPRLRRDAQTVRGALVRHLYRESQGLFARSDAPGTGFDAGARLGNGLAALWRLSPGSAPEILARLGGSQAPPSALEAAVEAEAWMLAGRPAEALALVRARLHEGSPADAAPAWLLRSFVLGIRPTSPGFETFVVAPQLGSLGRAEGEMAVPGGLAVRVRAEARPAGLELHVDAPPGLRGSVAIPADVAEVTVDGAVGSPRKGLVDLPPGRSVVEMRRRAR